MSRPAEAHGVAAVPRRSQPDRRGSESSRPITREALHHAMSMVVDQHEDVASVMRPHGHRQYA
jgi:hypothetical protein